MMLPSVLPVTSPPAVGHLLSAWRRGERFDQLRARRRRFGVGEGAAGCALRGFGVFERGHGAPCPHDVIRMRDTLGVRDCCVGAFAF